MIIIYAATSAFTLFTVLIFYFNSSLGSDFHEDQLDTGKVNPSDEENRRQDIDIIAEMIKMTPIKYFKYLELEVQEPFGLLTYCVNKTPLLSIRSKPH